MRAVVERVSHAEVRVEDGVVGSIDRGLLVYLGIASDDTAEDIAYLVNKVRSLRVFNDDDGKLNRNVTEVNGGCLVVSAFTTLGDTRRGNRPTYVAAADAEKAGSLYQEFCRQLAATGVPVATGQFRAKMAVHSINDGPICTLMDSRKQF